MNKYTAICAFAFLILASPSVKAQEPETIKVRKESDLAKVVIDNTENRLMVVDRFGNPRDNRVVSYKLYVKSKSNTREFPGYSNALTDEMLNCLNSQSSAVKIFVTDIMVKDDHDNIVKLPDAIETWFPDCKNCSPSKKKARNRE